LDTSAIFSPGEEVYVFYPGQIIGIHLNIEFIHNTQNQTNGTWLSPWLFEAFPKYPDFLKLFQLTTKNLLVLFSSSSSKQINIAAPTTGLQKVIEIDDEKRLQNFYERRMASEIDGEALGDEFAGYVFRISGGNDKQGFPMRQGVLTNTRVRLLCKKGQKTYRQRRTGERKRKSVRGCIVAQDIAVLNLVITKMGAEPIAELTDTQVPRRLGPKRASNIRKLFNLSKDDDVREYVVARTFTNKSGGTCRKAPKIQRLVTPLTLQRKRARKAEKKNSVLRNKAEAAAYKKVVAQRLAEQKEARRSLISKRRSTRKSQKLAAAS
jgi:small subunit ribosomal protein S6e